MTRSLTGVWDGQYTYRGGVSATAFTVTLLDIGGSLSGSTHEQMPRFGFLTATLNGERKGSGVAFRKVYDAVDDDLRPIDYEGSVNAEATEIEGSWRIPGWTHGRFLMIRAERKAASAERRETARA